MQEKIGKNCQKYILKFCQNCKKLTVKKTNKLTKNTLKTDQFYKDRQKKLLLIIKNKKHAKNYYK